MLELAQKLKEKAVLRVGFLEKAKYPDGTSVGLVAMVQDFGAPSRGIPPRPFFRNMIRKNEASWPKAIAKTLTMTQYDIPKTLKLVGEGIAGQLRQSIIDTNSPPLSPITVQRKGHSKPLVDTGHMLQSVDYEVKK